MFILDKIARNLTDEELKKAYDELMELKTEGVLISGIVRDCIKKTVAEVPTLDVSIAIMEKAILHEIAYRYYR